MRPVVFIVFCFTASGGIVIPAIGQYGPGDSVWVETEEVNSMLIARGKFHNSDDERIEISYKLVTDRIGGSGTASTTQSGQKAVDTGSTIDLSTVFISIKSGDCYMLALDVYMKDVPVNRAIVIQCVD